MRMRVLSKNITVVRVRLRVRFSLVFKTNVCSSFRKQRAVQGAVCGAAEGAVPLRPHVPRLSIIISIKDEALVYC